MGKYYPRIADIEIKKRLDIMGAVVIEGPKWCGKTTTAEQFAKSKLYLADTEKMQDYKVIGDVNPKSMLEGEKPRLIDEWQVAPKLWDAIRFDVDHNSSFGLYLLTGSSTPQDKSDIFHSGTGRFAWVKMRPMTLFESGDSTGEVSLKELFTDKEKLYGKSKLTELEELAYLACRGGWPQVKNVKEKEASLRLAFEYVHGLIRADLANQDINDRKAERLSKLLRALARNQGTQASQETIMTDMGVNATSQNTLKSDLEQLDRLFVTDDLLAWNPNLRSKTAIRTSDTHYFIDPSIATAALGLGPQDLMNDFNTFGLVAETMCIRDLQVYAEANDGNVYHYRDKSGLECDAVIHLRNGKYGLIEIKLGGEDLINEGAKTLLSLSNKIDTTKMNAPSFCAVITGVGNFAYRRPEDGVLVVPIGCLKP